MARVSFTLRRTDTTPDLGSYLRYDDAQSYETSTPGGGSAGASVAPFSRTDYDSALRADGLQIAPEVFEDTFFEAISVCYGEVDLDWAVNISESPADTPVVTEVLVVYSATGEPQTIASGTVLVESSSEYSYQHGGLPEGKWAYYSLFVHYESTGGDSYYERVASLSVLVPKNYGSTMDLWNRIPAYYRLQDQLLGEVTEVGCYGTLPADNVIGPLFKYLSIIGFDMDRIRTIIDHVMVSRDPSIAHSTVLTALGQQMGTILTTSDLGAQRMRALMNDIGFYRRSQGTEIGIEYFAKSVSNSDISIDQVNREITIYSQRVNYVTVPKTGAGIITHRAAGDVEHTEANALPFSDATYAAYSGSYDYSGTDFTTTGTGSGDDVNSVIFHIDSVVPVELGDTVGFSVHSNIGTDALKWVRVVDASENVMGFSDVAKSVDGVRAYEVNIDNGGSAGAASLSVFTDGYIEACVDLSAVPVFDLSYMLAERNYLGSYFDGDTIRGGWLVDSSSVSDYRWAGSANSSQSIFAEDYERSKSILRTLLFDVLPVTEADNYTIISYNAIPGIS